MYTSLEIVGLVVCVGLVFAAGFGLHRLDSAITREPAEVGDEPGEGPESESVVSPAAPSPSRSSRRNRRHGR